MRRQARELAVCALFQVEFAPQVNLSELLQLLDSGQEVADLDYAELLVSGVIEHKEELDRLISSFSKHWSLSRMSVVDRNVLRMACFELRFGSETIDSAVVINEAVAVGKKFGSSDSSSFINGVLDAVARELA